MILNDRYIEEYMYVKTIQSICRSQSNHSLSVSMGFVCKYYTPVLYPHVLTRDTPSCITVPIQQQPTFT